MLYLLTVRSTPQHPVLEPPVLLARGSRRWGWSDPAGGGTVAPIPRFADRGTGGTLCSCPPPGPRPCARSPGATSPPSGAVGVDCTIEVASHRGSRPVGPLPAGPGPGVHVEGCDRPQARRGWCATPQSGGGPPGIRCRRPKPLTIPTPCAVDGCPRPVTARGWCPRHYNRWRRTGDPGPVQLLRPGPPRRLHGGRLRPAPRGPRAVWVALPAAAPNRDRRAARWHTVESRRLGVGIHGVALAASAHR